LHPSAPHAHLRTVCEIRQSSLSEMHMVQRGQTGVQRLSHDGAGRDSVRNDILLQLPKEEFNRILPRLQPVHMPTHRVLLEMEQPIKSAYFIQNGLASILNVMSDGKSVEVGLFGKEGFAGIPLCVGFTTSPSQVVMQVMGDGLKLSADDLLELLDVCPNLAKALQRFSQMMAMQATQIAACNRLHDVDERLARWLLMSQDRLFNDIVPLTQEFLAHMLGTRRATVTVAAGMLQKAGLITYDGRGKVKIVNRSRLKDAACECYNVIVDLSKKWQHESDGM
jgi:CRP-like cAMP-binding protein